jgi:hypothetical protein
MIDSIDNFNAGDAPGNSARNTQTEGTGLCGDRTIAASAVPSTFEGEEIRARQEPCPTETLDHVMTPRDFPPGTRMDDIKEAQARALLCEQYLDLCKTMSGNQAAMSLGKSPSWFAGEQGMLAKYLGGGLSGLLPRRRECGAKPSDEAKLVSEGDIARIKAILLKSNRAKNKGSRDWAIRQYAKAADCPAPLREMVQRRYREGKLLLPPSVLKRIWISETTVSQYRNPTNASLDFLSAPGSTMWWTDPENGERRFILPGQVIEADDATINFPVCVPWEMGGCPCSEKYGVKVARFQWLVAMDVASRFVPAWTYVCRAKSSYRDEDTVTLMNAVYRTHGEPLFWRFEHGVWASNKVKQRIQFTGSQRWPVWSPHQKPYIEGLWNKMWTYLSLEDGQVGRYRGEMEKENDLLMAGQQGRRDPRGTFPLLSRAIAAFESSIGDHHAGIIRSKDYGEWIPAERWERRQMQKPAVDLDWLAAPFVRRWKVSGNVVGGAVRLFDSYSAPFQFSAEWLPQFHGAYVNCHFDPTVPRCSAVVSLAEDWRDRKAGELLGTVQLVNECASFARLVMQWGDDDRGLGRKIRAKAQGAMRREVRTIGADGTFRSGTSEIRDGQGNSAKVERGESLVPAAPETNSGGTPLPQRREEFPATTRRQRRDLFAETEQT